jgi:hypothetical protein
VLDGRRLLHARIGLRDARVSAALRVIVASLLVASCSAHDAADGGVDAFSSDAEVDAPMGCVPYAPRGTETGVGTACTAASLDGACLVTTDCPAPSSALTAGLCPGPASVECCSARYAPSTVGTWTCDPADFVTPDPCPTEAPGAGGCPDGMLRVSTFCIDRYEAALVLVNDDGTTMPWSPYFNPGTHRVRAVSVAGVVPQGYVSGEDARAACAEAGKRLCTDAEWLRACQGPAGTTYPYGDTRMTGVCNDHRAMHPAVELYGTSDPSVFSKIDNPCIDQLHDSAARTGAFAGCVTVEGASDMMGNLHEWTADPAGTFRGGFYVDTVLNGPGCLYATTAHDTHHWDYSTGFRCCAD